MTSIRILIADDHPVVRAGLIGMLDSEPDLQVVAEATDGQQAVELTARHRPDVVLIDLQMPRMDGVTAIGRICDRPEPPRILVLTTYDSGAQILAAIEAGATGYLLKDTPREDLFRAIRAAAGGGAPLSPTVAARLVDQVRSGTPETLSARELDVLRLVARGASNSEIGRDLRISQATVKTHLLHIFEKLEVGDRTSAVTTALQRGIIELPT